MNPTVSENPHSDDETRILPTRIELYRLPGDVCVCVCVVFYDTSRPSPFYICRADNIISWNAYTGIILAVPCVYKRDKKAKAAGDSYMAAGYTRYRIGLGSDRGDIRNTYSTSSNCASSGRGRNTNIMDLSRVFRAGLHTAYKAARMTIISAAVIIRTMRRTRVKAQAARPCTRLSRRLGTLDVVWIARVPSYTVYRKRGGGQTVVARARAVRN